MIYFKLFITLTSFLCFLLNSYNVIALIIFLICLFISFRESKKLFIIELVIIGLFIISFLIFVRVYDGKDTLVGIVIKRSKGYFILKTIKGNLYVDSRNNNYEIFDILKIEGSYEELKFFHYECSFNFPRYLNSFGVYNSFKVKKIDYVFRNFIRLGAFKDSLVSSYSKESQILINALLFKGSLSKLSSYDNLQGANLLFLLSTSNIHITFLILLVDKYLIRYVKESYLRVSRLVFVLLIYFISEFNFSLIRLVLMSSINLFLYFKKNLKLDYLTKLSIVGSLTLILNPYYVLNIGFFYTYVLLFFFNLRGAFFTDKDRFNKIRTSVYFVMVLLPLQFFMDPTYNVLSFLFQVIVSPLLSVLYILEHLVYLGDLTVPFLDRLNLLIIKILNSISNLKLMVQVGDFNYILVIVYYLILSLVILTYELRIKSFKLISTSLLFIFIVLNICPYRHFGTEVHFIDVGQGDCTLVRKDDTSFLIDTGGNKFTDLGYQCLYKYFAKIRLRKLDAVFITHLDFDHYGALDSLKKLVNIDNIYFASNDIYKYKVNDIYIEDLNTYKDGSDDNNFNSGVFKFELNDKKFLVMGDAPIEIEKKILKDKKSVKCDILKVGHHGSKTSSSLNFLKECDPSLCVISCGYKNIYQHPNKEVINNLNRLNLNYYRTDIDGTLVYKV